MRSTGPLLVLLVLPMAYLLLLLLLVVSPGVSSTFVDLQLDNDTSGIEFCSQFASCGSCNGTATNVTIGNSSTVITCGWCGSSLSCLPGSSSGPAPITNQTCLPGWYHASCPDCASRGGSCQNCLLDLGGCFWCQDSCQDISIVETCPKPTRYVESCRNGAPPFPSLLAFGVAAAVEEWRSGGVEEWRSGDI